MLSGIEIFNFFVSDHLNTYFHNYAYSAVVIVTAEWCYNFQTRHEITRNVHSVHRVEETGLKFLNFFTVASCTHENLIQEKILPFD